MANKDFRAKQIRTSRIIGSGSLIGSDKGLTPGQTVGGSPHTTIMSASNASDFIGGITNSTTFDAVGRDVGLFISGSTGKRSRWAAWSSGDVLSQGGVTLVGGDLHISGNVTAEGSGLGGYITGTFNEPTTGGAFVTTASVSIAGNEGFTFRAKSGGPTGGVGTGTDVFFFVSGSRTRSGSDDRSDVDGPAVALFGGDLVVSGTLYAERQVIEVDERVDGAFYVSGAIEVAKGAVINAESGTSDFRVETDNDTHALFVQGSGDVVAVGTALPDGDARLHIGNSNTNAKTMLLVENEAVGNDYDAQVSFAKAGTVSHSIGIDDSDSDKLKITTGDDLDVAAASIVEMSSTETVFNEGSQDLDFRVETDGDTHALFVDAGQNTVGIGTNAPAASVQLHVGNASAAAGSRTIIQLENEYAGNDYDTQITFAKGGTATYAFGVDDSDSDKLKIATGGLLGGANSSVLEVSAAEVVLNEDANDVNFRVETAGRPGAIIVDAHNNKVAFASAGTDASNAYGNSLSIPADISVYLSGTVGSRQGALPGVIVSAGDLHVSGNLTVDGSSPGGGGGTVSSGSFNEPLVGGNFVTTASLALAGALPGGLNLDISTIGPDVYFFVSGAIGKRLVSGQNVAVFGGDVVHSGSVHILDNGTSDENLRLVRGPSGNNYIVFEDEDGTDRGQIYSNGAHLFLRANTNDLIFRAGTANVLRMNGSTERIGIGNDVSAPTHMLHVSGTQPTALRVDTGNVENALIVQGEKVLILSGGSGLSGDPTNNNAIQFFVSGTIGGGDGIRRDNGLALFGGDLVLSGNLFIDPAGASQKLALGPDAQDAYIKAVGPIPGATGGRAIDLAATMLRVGYDASERLGGSIPADSNVYISGSIGSRGTAPSSKDRRGTAIFGGDVVVSGSLRGRQLHYSTHKYTAGGTAQQYLRFDANGSDASPGANNKMIAPFEGSLVKVIARGTSAGGSTTISLHTNTDGNTNVNTTATGTAQTVDMNSADTSFTFDFVDDANYGVGDIIGLSVNPQFDPGNVVVTAVWEYYTHEP